METNKAILGWATMTMIWAAPSVLVWHFVGPVEGRWFFAGGVSMVFATMMFMAFKRNEGG